MTAILAIDPGPQQSGFVLFAWPRVMRAGVALNDQIFTLLDCAPDDALLAVEKIEAMGMAVGAETFETVYWSGRFHEAWRRRRSAAIHRITRREVKLHLCGSMRAKDPNIRQALLDVIGPQGTKKAPGPTYGVSSHAWAALAVAVTCAHKLGAMPLRIEQAAA